jgi:hypothetical protein
VLTVPSGCNDSFLKREGIIAEDDRSGRVKMIKIVTAGKGADSWGMNAVVTAVVVLP